MENSATDEAIERIDTIENIANDSEIDADNNHQQELNGQQQQQTNDNDDNNTTNDNKLIKIEVLNLPVNITYPTFLKFLRKKHIKYRKMKLLSVKSTNKSISFLTFRNEQEQTDAIAKLDDLEFRGRRLKCQQSNDQLPDPFVVHLSKKNMKNKNNNVKTDDIKDDDIDQLYENCQNQSEKDEIINNQVCSLWQMPYDLQIERKIEQIKLMWDKFSQEFRYTKPDQDLSGLIQKFCHENSLKMNERFIKSPVINGYRNKYEFNIGKDRQIGFRLGLYRQGSIRVVRPPNNCPIISPKALEILDYFQRYLNEHTTLDGFDPLSHQGYWRQLLVRSNSENESLIAIRFVRQPSMNDEQFEAEYKKLTEYFSESAESLKIKSIHLEIIENNLNSNQFDSSRLLYGQTHIYEKLKLTKHDSNNTDSNEINEPNEEILEFRISSTSFFQVNKSASELLYGKIFELSKCNRQNTIILDICCGTGTIGLCMARNCRKIIGFELNEQAIDDAKFNASHNHIDNVEYHCGRVEKLIGQTLDHLCNNLMNENNAKDIEFVAILDPPRNGLPSNIMKCLRNNSRIRRVIYVACEAMYVRNNFIDLCRPISRAYHREPFIPIESFVVDLFPHTERSELIVMFERLSDHLKAADDQM